MISINELLISLNELLISIKKWILYPYLLISINEFFISIIHLLISNVKTAGHTFPHFSENVPHFWLYFEKKVPNNRDNFKRQKETLCVMVGPQYMDFRLYDENSSSNGR